MLSQAARAVISGAYQISRSKMLRIAAVLVAGASALQAPRLSSAPALLNAATLEQPPAASKDLLPRERYVLSYFLQESHSLILET